jgi:hypothetical protein
MPPYTKRVFELDIRTLPLHESKQSSIAFVPVLQTTSSVGPLLPDTPKMQFLVAIWGALCDV